MRKFLSLLGFGAVGAVASVLAMSACSSSSSKSGGGNTQDSGPSKDGGTDTGTVGTNEGGPSTGDSGMSCPAVDAGCTNAGCTTQFMGDAGVCVEGKCVQLGAPNCPIVHGPVDQDNAIIVGVSHAFYGPNAQGGYELTDVLAYSFDEINKAGGVQSSDPCQANRPIAFVACDETNFLPDGGVFSIPDGGPDAESPREKSWDHLLNDLKVPVTFSGVTSGDCVDFADYSILSHNEMVIATRAGAPDLVDQCTTSTGAACKFAIGGEPYIWRASQNAEIETTAMGALYAQMEPIVKAAHNKTSLKVALLFNNTPFEIGYAQLLRAGALTINGMVYNPPANGPYGRTPDVVDINYQFPDGQNDFGVTGMGVQATLTAVQTEAPDIIILVGADEGIGDFFQPIETALASMPESSKPYWLGARSMRSVTLDNYVNSISTNKAMQTSVLSRVRGLFPGLYTPQTQDFYNEGFLPAYPNTTAAMPSPTQLIDGVRELYDAAYFLTYAMTAANIQTKGAITSASIVDNMKVFYSGTMPFNVGPTDYKAAMAQVTAGTAIQLQGVFSNLQFDPTTAEAPSPSSLWCIKLDPNTGMAVDDLTTGEAYDPVMKKLTGTFSCQ